MPRVKKTEIAIKEPEVTWKDPDSYIDYTSSLIRLGVFMSNKAKSNGKAITDGVDALYGVEGQSLDLSSQQVQYLNMLMDGMSTKDACKSLQLDRATPILWEETAEKDSVYNCCLTILQQIKANDIEDKVIDVSLYDNDWRRDTARMFVMKRFKPEYRENAPVTTNAVQVNISVANQPFEVITETKIINDEGATNA